MERFCTSLKSGDAAQLAVICYHSARTVQEWDGYAFDEVTFQKLGDEYEVGLTRKYRSFQNTTITYRLKLNCLDPGNTPFPSGYSEWLMDVGDESSDYDGTYMEAYNLRQEDVPVIGLPFGETFDRDPVKMTESPVLSLMRSKILRSAGRSSLCAQLLCPLQQQLPAATAVYWNGSLLCLHLFLQEKAVFLSCYLQ